MAEKKGDTPSYIPPYSKCPYEEPWTMPPDAEGTDGHGPQHTHVGEQPSTKTNW